MHFELQLKAERIKPHQSTGLHLLVALATMMSGAIILFLYKLFKVGASDNVNQPLERLKWISIVIILGGLFLLWFVIFRNKKLLHRKLNLSFRIAELALMAFFTWFSVTRHVTIPAVTYGILTAAVCFAIIWENTKNVLHIRVDDEGIALPANVRLRFVAWPQVEKVLLRYGVLTIDCADNKLLQLDVVQPTFNTESFEQYCDTKIEEGKKKRDEEW